jgi:flagellar biosynthesis/type III secretory pathway protein FliH
MSTLSVIKIPRPLGDLNIAGEVLEEIEEEIKEETQERFDQEEANQLTLMQIRLEQLERELQTAREEFYNGGFQDGLEAKREKHRQEMEAHAQQFRELSERLEKEFDQALSSMEEPLLRMSFRIAEKILTASLPEDYRNESLVGNIQSFLKEVLHEGGVVVHVAPENLAFIQSEEISEKLQQSYPGRIRFVANETLSPGECLVETPEHIIDGRYHNQLEILESKIR